MTVGDDCICVFLILDGALSIVTSLLMNVVLGYNTLSFSCVGRMVCIVYLRIHVLYGQKI